MIGRVGIKKLNPLIVPIHKIQIMRIFNSPEKSIKSIYFTANSLIVI